MTRINVIGTVPFCCKCIALICGLNRSILLYSSFELIVDHHNRHIPVYMQLSSHKYMLTVAAVKMKILFCTTKTKLLFLKYYKVVPMLANYLRMTQVSAPTELFSRTAFTELASCYLQLQYTHLWPKQRLCSPCQLLLYLQCIGGCHKEHILLQSMKPCQELQFQ